MSKGLGMGEGGYLFDREICNFLDESCPDTRSKQLVKYERACIDRVRDSYILDKVYGERGW
jgi:hypothetical protein